MNRPELLAQLRAHLPFDEHERAMTERLTAFVETHDNFHSRELLIGHLTGSAWVIDLERTHALLTHHRKLNLWVQLGGHCEDDASMREAAHREAREESGLLDVRLADEAIFDIDIHEIPARRDEPAHFHYDVRYLFEADRHAPLIVSSESKELAWVALDEIERLTQEESVLRMVRKTKSLFSRN
jgi:8-oxo-dGTP pyrophosphatase MutT (NUDIX family)